MNLELYGLLVLALGVVIAIVYVVLAAPFEGSPDEKREQGPPWRVPDDHA